MIGRPGAVVVTALAVAATAPACTGQCDGPECEASFGASRLALHLGGPSPEPTRGVWNEADGLIDGEDADGADWSVSHAEGLLVLGQPDADRTVLARTSFGEAPVAALSTWTGASSSRFGAAVAASAVGDEGTWDLMVGAPDHDLERGAAFLFRRGDQRIGADQGSADVRIVGVTAGDHLGERVWWCPDLTGDGVGDWVLAAPQLSAPLDGPFSGDEFGIPSLAGAVFLFDGAALSEAVGTVDVREAARVWWGELAAGLGRAVDCRGDLTGDGQADLVVGAPFFGKADEGAVFVVAGGPVGSLPVSSDIARAATRGWTGAGPDGWFGYAVATGDFDANGVTDLAVGSPGASDGRGKAEVFLGGGVLAAAELPEPVAISASLTRPVGDHVGRWLARGDVDGGGVDDLLVGSPDWVASSSFDAGWLGVWLGELAPWSDGVIGQDEDLVIAGGLPYQRVGERLLVADIDEDGVDDIALPTRKAN